MNKDTGQIPLEAVQRILSDCGIDVPEASLDSLCCYLSLLQSWNRVMNLVGPRGWRDMLTELVADSFHLAAFLEDSAVTDNPESWDLGAGAGLPGIPLRMVWTRGRYTMVEAREKRALFLQTAIARCGLADTEAVMARAEKFFAAREGADLILSRAFMPWQKLLPFVRSQLRPRGKIVVLALHEPPLLPDNWRLVDSREYPAAGQRRYFWLLEAVCP